MKWLVPLALAALAAAALADSDEDAKIEEENGVLVLTEKNFDKALADHEHILVEFYAPWCGHCKQLAPEYDKAAEKLSKSGSKIRLAKVDATVEKELGNKHGVRGFPTLKFFKSGESKDYNGPREAEGIVNWLEKKTGPPAKEVKTADEVDAVKEEKDVVALGLFKDADSDAAKEFLKAAEDNDDQTFVVSHEEALFEKYGVTDESAVIVFKSFDEGRADYSGEMAKKDIDAFVRSESLPLVSEFSPENAPKIFGTEVKAHLLLIAPKDGKDYEKQMAALKAPAKKNKGKLIFVFLDSSVDENKQIMEFFGLKDDDLPEYLIYAMEESAKYLSGKDEVVESEVAKFCESYHAGELKRTLKSEDLPDDWDKEPVKVLVSSNFKDVALDKGKDVFVEFYAPWCGHCKALAPKWEKLGEHFKDSDSVVIAKMDSTANEIEEVTVEGFPTLKLFKKDTNEIIDYNGKRETEDMIKFLESGGKEGAEDDDEEEDDDGEEDDDDEKAKHEEL